MSVRRLNWDLRRLAICRLASHSVRRSSFVILRSEAAYTRSSPRRPRVRLYEAGALSLTGSCPRLTRSWLFTSTGSSYFASRSAKPRRATVERCGGAPGGARSTPPRSCRSVSIPSERAFAIGRGSAAAMAFDGTAPIDKRSTPSGMQNQCSLRVWQTSSLPRRMVLFTADKLLWP